VKCPLNLNFLQWRGGRERETQCLMQFILPLKIFLYKQAKNVGWNHSLIKYLTQIRKLSEGHCLDAWTKFVIVLVDRGDIIQLSALRAKLEMLEEVQGKKVQYMAQVLTKLLYTIVFMENEKKFFKISLNLTHRINFIYKFPYSWINLSEI